MCPARRSGRSEKQIVKGSTLRRVSFPSAKLKPAAFWTKSSWTLAGGFVSWLAVLVVFDGLVSADDAPGWKGALTIRISPPPAKRRCRFMVGLLFLFFRKTPHGAAQKMASAA